MERYSDDPPAVELLRQVEKLQQRDKLEELCLEGLKQAVRENKLKPRKHGMTPEKARENFNNWFNKDFDFEDKPNELEIEEQIIREEQVVIGGLETTIQLEKRRIDETLISDDQALD